MNYRIAAYMLCVLGTVVIGCVDWRIMVGVHLIGLSHACFIVHYNNRPPETIYDD